ncbi:MAG: helix-turn-helix domain-containing protein [Christensenellales bacterium]
MEELKKIIASNIINLRKENNLTQAEFATKLNYTDKAISKWERGESVPSIDILKKIADMFGVTVDFLLHEGSTKEKEQYILPQDNRSNKIIITLLGVSIVWIVVTIIYVYMKIFANVAEWRLFLWAVPLSCLVLQIFNFLWGKKLFSLYILSIFVWSLLTCLYLQFITYQIWLIFVIGVPIQIAIILWSNLKPINKQHKNSKK